MKLVHALHFTFYYYFFIANTGNYPNTTFCTLIWRTKSIHHITVRFSTFLCNDIMMMLTETALLNAKCCDDQLWIEHHHVLKAEHGQGPHEDRIYSIDMGHIYTVYSYLQGSSALHINSLSKLQDLGLLNLICNLSLVQILAQIVCRGPTLDKRFTM